MLLDDINAFFEEEEEEDLLRVREGGVPMTNVSMADGRWRWREKNTNYKLQTTNVRPAGKLKKSN